MVRIENNSHMLEITYKVAFFEFLSFFFTFAHKVVQTWFVLHETRQRILFGIYYSVIMVTIENYSHMLEIMC